MYIDEKGDALKYRKNEYHGKVNLKKNILYETLTH